MSAIIKDTMRVFTANQFLNLFGTTKTVPWESGKTFGAGALCVHNNNRYITVNGGIAGATPPVHNTGEQSDGGIVWLYVESNIDNDFYENNVYVSIGKIDAWDDENNPPIPLNYDLSESKILNDSYFFKKINETNVSMAIANHTWLSGTVYDQYDDKVEDFNYANPWYVMNSEPEKNIYKCIFNNNGAASLSEPTGQSVQPFTTADGYIWQYMGSVSASAAITFLTDDYIPVSNKTSNDGSVQWLVQQAAKVGSTSSVEITNGGNNYTQTPTLLIEPSAGETITTPMQANAVVVNNIIERIDIVDYGVGYVEPPTIKVIPDAADTGNHQPTIKVSQVGANGEILDISITGAGQYFDPITSVVITTTTGDGTADLTPILNEAKVLVGFNINVAGTGYSVGDIITLGDGTTNAHDCEFRVIMQPNMGHGHSIIEELNAKNLIVAFRLETDEAGFLDTSIKFRQCALVLDPLVANDSSFAEAPRYKGKANPSFTGSGTDEIKPSTGKILYIENFEPIQRAANQIEDIKLIIKF